MIVQNRRSARQVRTNRSCCECQRRDVDKRQERSIAERAGKLAQTRYCAITPSRLDHGAYAPTRADRAADAEDGTPAAPTILQDRTEEVGATPCGAHWGTIVHSVMEQAVRRGDHSPSARCV